MIDVTDFTRRIVQGESPEAVARELEAFLVQKRAEAKYKGQPENIGPNWQGARAGAAALRAHADAIDKLADASEALANGQGR